MTCSPWVGNTQETDDAVGILGISLEDIKPARNN